MYLSQTDGYLSIIDGSTNLLSSTYLFTGINSDIFYDPINSSVYLFDDIGLVSFNNGTSSYISGVGTSSFSTFLFDHVSGNICISQVGQMSNYELDGTLDNSFLLNGYGQISVSAYDSFIYLSSQVANQVLIIDSNNGFINYTANFSSSVTKTIFNPERNSMFGIQPGQNQLIEISAQLSLQSTNSSLTYSTDFENMYGTLASDYVPHPDLWLKTRE